MSSQLLILVLLTVVSIQWVSSTNFDLSGNLLLTYILLNFSIFFKKTFKFMIWEKTIRARCAQLMKQESAYISMIAGITLSSTFLMFADLLRRYHWYVAQSRGESAQQVNSFSCLSRFDKKNELNLQSARNTRKNIHSLLMSLHLTERWLSRSRNNHTWRELDTKFSSFIPVSQWIFTAADHW